MYKQVDLPLTEPIYGTYHFQAPGSAVIADNPSIINWYLEHSVDLICTRKFLSGYTTPELSVKNSYWLENPFLEKIWIDMRFIKRHTNSIIRDLLDNGFYVAFEGVDDFYIRGKSWYGQRHFSHDGMICGYDQKDKSFSVYAYDTNWIYRKFKTSQKCFSNSVNHGWHVSICGLKPKQDKAEFLAWVAYDNILEYLDSSLVKYPMTPDKNEKVYGIVVQDYIVEYLNRLINGSVPYERMDRRIFRLIWEHKKVMLKRIQAIEQSVGYNNFYSESYKGLVVLADNMRMMYAAHAIKRRDPVLPMIQKNLRYLIKTEKDILSDFTINIEKGLVR